MNFNLKRRWCCLVYLIVTAVTDDVIGSADRAVNIQWKVEEELQPSTPIGDLRLSLKDYVDQALLSRYKYQLLPRPNQDLSTLTIDPHTGVIRTSGLRRLDREAVCPPSVGHHQHHHHQQRASNECAIDVSVGLVNNGQLEQVVSIKIVLLDVNDNAPVFAQPQYEIRLSESTAPGTIVVLPTATDADSSPQHGVAGYRLKSRYSEFKLQTSTPDGTSSKGTVVPQLVVTSSLRLDSGPYTMVLEAYDGALPVAMTGTTVIVVSVEDANDHAPSFSRPSVTIEVGEDYPLADAVFQARATDQDRGANADISYSLDTISQLAVGNVFKVHRSTGEVYLKRALDYERETEYVMVIQAVDGGTEPLTGSQTLTIRVVDVNDNRPMLTVNTLQSATVVDAGNAESDTGNDVATGRGHSVEVAENSDSGSFVAHLSVYDVDSGSGGMVSCRLDSASTASFQLTRLVAGQYKLTTSRRLDYEHEPALPVTVTCTDSGQPSLSTTVNITVNVLDVNDNAPQFVESLYNVTVTENNVQHVTILQVRATDADSGVNGHVSYSLGEDDQSLASLVDVDEKTGEIRLSASLDHEAHKHLVFRVRARDGGLYPLFDTAEVVVTIEDINDEEPQFSQPQYTFQIPEGSAEGTEVGFVSAFDRDSPPFNRHVFTIVDAYSIGVDELFAINPKSGRIIATAVFDREKHESYKFTVAAIDEDKPSLRSEVPVVVEIGDVNDHDPYFEFPTEENRTFPISASVPAGFTIARVVARDRDTGNNSRLVYRVTTVSDKQPFAINGSTGVLTTAVDMSRADHLHSYYLRVVANDLGRPARTGSIGLIVVVDPSIPYVDRLHHPNAGLGTADSHGASPASAWYYAFADSPPLIVAVVGVCLGLVVVLVIVAALLAAVCRRRRSGAGAAGRENVYQCRLQEQKALQKLQHSSSMTGQDTAIGVGGSGSMMAVDGMTTMTANGNSFKSGGIGSMTSLHSNKPSSNNGHGRNGSRSAMLQPGDESTLPLMPTAEEMKLLKSLKEDLSDSECNITDNDLYSAINNTDLCGRLPPYEEVTGFSCQLQPLPPPPVAHTAASVAMTAGIRCRYSPVLAPKNGVIRHGSLGGAVIDGVHHQQSLPTTPRGFTGGPGCYNTINSTFKIHQNPMTYHHVPAAVTSGDGVVNVGPGCCIGTLPITTTVTDIGFDRYATIAGSGKGGNAARSLMAFYQTTAANGCPKKFPAHSAALGTVNGYQGFQTAAAQQSRPVDGGYFTDERQPSDGDSNSPVGSP